MFDPLIEVGLVQPCDQCGGRGIRGHHEHIDQSTGEHLGNQPIPCPSCSGRGMVVSDQAVEKGAKGAYERDTASYFLPQPEWGEVVDPLKVIYQNLARAALAAAIFGGEEE